MVKAACSPKSRRPPVGQTLQPQRGGRAALHLTGGSPLYPLPPEAQRVSQDHTALHYASPKEGRYDSQAIRCPYGPR
jgi:hypothetical protein